MTVQFHPKAFIRAASALAIFGALMLLGLDVRLGALAIVATAVVDALSFVLPFSSGFDRKRDVS